MTVKDDHPKDPDYPVSYALTEDARRALVTEVQTSLGMDIWVEVATERRRAHAKHGVSSMEVWSPTNLMRLTILLEEVGEVAREFNEASIGDREVDYTKLRGELIQVAAMAGAWADVL